MSGGQRPVECGELSRAVACESCEVAVCHLSVAVNRRNVYFGVRDRVRPELTPLRCAYASENGRGSLHRLADTQKEPDQCTLDNWTHRESCHRGEPLGGTFVMLVLGDRERDNDVGIQKERRHSSSSASATSSAVIRRPIESTGSPDLESVCTVTGSSTCAKPRTVRSAITAESDSPRRLASSRARRCSAGGRSAVVRTSAS